MLQQKIYGYMRVSTREQNEERQRVALLEMGLPVESPEIIQRVSYDAIVIALKQQPKVVIL